MLQIQRSRATTHNGALQEVRRSARQDNAAYVGANAATSRDETNLVLLGGVGPIDFRLRTAQAHVRDDLLPSAWSHLLLMGPPAKVPAKTAAFEIALYGREGVGFPPRTNGVAKVALGEYANTSAYPNVAVLRLPVPFSEVSRTIASFQTHRSTVDALEHLIAWWGYVWGVGRAQNPLLDGVGVPAAIFAEYVLGSLGYDLVPGFPSRASCPEAIWLSARWWFEFPRSASHAADERKAERAIGGAYDAEHYLVPRS